MINAVCMYVMVYIYLDSSSLTALALLRSLAKGETLLSFCWNNRVMQLVKKEKKKKTTTTYSYLSIKCIGQKKHIIYDHSDP